MGQNSSAGPSLDMFIDINIGAEWKQQIINNFMLYENAAPQTGVLK